VRPFKECHRRKQGQLSHPGEADEGRYFRASGHEYGRWPEEGHDAVTGTSRGADAGCFSGLDTQHDPWRASRLAWRTGGNDNGLLGALQPVDLLFELGDPLLALRQGARRVRDPVYLGHEPLNQNLRLKKSHQYV
jgi:hypothetical protein